MKHEPKRLGFWEGLLCLLALMGTVALAGMIGGTISPGRPHSHPVAGDTSLAASATLAQADLAAQQEMADWAFGAMIGGLLTMFGSFAALYFIRETLHATKETLQVERDRNAIEMRAYVVVIPMGIEQDVGRFDYRGQIELHNIGKTPAHDVSVKVWLKTAGFKESNFKTSAFKNPAQRTLLPDARMRQGTKNTGLVSEFMDGSGYIFVYGRVGYTDYLGVRRSTMFCHRYNKDTFEVEIDVITPASKPKVLIRKDMARHHIHGNKAD